MSFFDQAPSQDFLDYEEFFDGQSKIVPDGTELEALVYDGFAGMEEGKATNICRINLVITTKGEYYGQKYRYNAKVYDNDAAKRDLAMRNLQVLDVQAGMPFTKNGLELTTENIQKHWAGTSECRVKFGLLISEDDGREINFVRGFGWLRDKMPKQTKLQQQQQTQQPTVDDDDDIDF